MMNKDKIQCNACLELKETTEFYTDKRTKGGFAFSCKKCESDRRKLGKQICSECNLNRSMIYFKTDPKVCGRCIRPTHTMKEVYSDGTGLCKICGVVDRNTQGYCINMVKVWRQSGHLKYRYSIDINKYNEMLEIQNRCCAICKTPESELTKRLSVDHDHNCCPGETSCGKCIRKLLCVKCNFLLGCANDDIDILQTTINYLKEFRDASEF